MIITVNNMKIRISKDDSGKDRFTKKEVEDLVEREQTIVSGDHSHCLCRVGDGKVIGEIQ